ncbi:ErfK/YbiS/YcfS/YnhG family protein [Clostridium putrefaciens]|uniref:ErfK/YbiS/YcfS/YnhG family protein n=2 Tax=Clostridium putrefaciens TaxID=99675 RepID=A0A381J4W7_9CLOT|nr:L,D-transpeptidase [Clostridium putrefaciens]SUY45531.1 ErfK/YbiS/YcfS/YnhG family protein [Clostridium putrefaciens]SUY72772.1 ErfK/YbiS/YcfS/YnhG family protein [Clostridium putrefaciens]
MLKYFNNRRLIRNLIIIISTLIILSYAALCLKLYSKDLSTFKECFDNGDYIKANSIILNKGNFNIIKKIKIKKDLNTYFLNCIEQLEINENENNNEISEISREYILYTLREIERYDVVNSKITEIKDSMPMISSSRDVFEKAYKLFNDKDYVSAMKGLNEITPIYPEYLEVLDMKINCYSKIKEDTLDKADKLAKDKYYSKAISLIEDNLSLLKEDKELIDKVKEYEGEKGKYLSRKQKEEVQAVFNKQEVSAKQNINSFDIASGTNYLIIVNIKDQKTYVYKGSKNKWSLTKEFLCSTGVNGKETPKGTFTVQNKGDWFYTDKYDQGGKYWVGFKGNYLFHSVPFDKEQKKIVDTTLGKPASHGCIRLKVDESKWVYDNVPIGSKVIVK